MRGLDYYARTLFEFTSDALGAQSGVGGGGRYDGLIEQLGGPADARPAGWAAGVERMLLAAGELPIPAGARRPVRRPSRAGRRTPPAFALAAEARRAGLSAQLELAGRSLQGPAQARRPDRRPLRCDRRRRVTISLRNMESGEQVEIEPAAVIPAILRGSRLT